MSPVLRARLWCFWKAEAFRSSVHSWPRVGPAFEPWKCKATLLGIWAPAHWIVKCAPSWHYVGIATCEKKNVKKINQREVMCPFSSCFFCICCCWWWDMAGGWGEAMHFDFIPVERLEMTEAHCRELWFVLACERPLNAPRTKPACGSPCSTSKTVTSIVCARHYRGFFSPILPNTHIWLCTYRKLHGRS